MGESAGIGAPGGLVNAGLAVNLHQDGERVCFETPALGR